MPRPPTQREGEDIKTATYVAVLRLQPYRIDMPNGLGILFDGPVG